MTFRLRMITLAVSAALTLGVVGCTPQKADKGAEGADKGTEPASEASLVDRLQPIVEKSSRGQFKATKTFDGPDGLVGVLLEGNQGGGKIVAWTSPNGEVLMPGPLFDKDGTNLSETMLAEHAGYISTKDLADGVQNLGFVAGKSGPIVTVFFEPYCGYCQKLFKDIQPMIDSGKLRARFVFVGFLRPESIARAAELSFAKDPYKGLKAWEGRADKAAAPAPQGVTADQEAAIRSNGELMGKAGQTGTPALVICKKDGSLELVKGMPGDFKAFAETIGDQGHPACNTP